MINKKDLEINQDLFYFHHLFCDAIRSSHLHRSKVY